MTQITKSQLLTVEEMGRADALAVKAGVPSLELMENAGQSVFKTLRQHWTRRRVVVLCGPGNNGGDGFVVARYLNAAGWPVTLGLLGEIKKLKGDAKANAKKWEGEVHSLDVSLLNETELVVDALFGAGLARDIGGVTKDIINEINSRNLECLAIDMPSGVDGDTGQVQGGAPQAQLTVTFFRKKLGHLLLPGRALCGEVQVTDIGIPETVLEKINPSNAGNAPANWLDHLPEQSLSDHKYSRGHV
ncbi:MAG TPA: NAD(P)H-hydrate epimerase, partial [Rhodospirillales bacterium]|nr:NAD(P)H-hydrate epimerase [Rhodospirillales bacterium]